MTRPSASVDETMPRVTGSRRLPWHPRTEAGVVADGTLPQSRCGVRPIGDWRAVSVGRPTDRERLRSRSGKMLPRDRRVIVRRVQRETIVRRSGDPCPGTSARLAASPAHASTSSRSRGCRPSRLAGSWRIRVSDRTWSSGCRTTVVDATGSRWRRLDSLTSSWSPSTTTFRVSVPSPAPAESRHTPRQSRSSPRCARRVAR